MWNTAHLKHSTCDHDAHDITGAHCTVRACTKSGEASNSQHCSPYSGFVGFLGDTFTACTGQSQHGSESSRPSSNATMQSGGVQMGGDSHQHGHPGDVDRPGRTIDSRAVCSTGLQLVLNTTVHDVLITVVTRMVPPIELNSLEPAFTSNGPRRHIHQEVGHGLTFSPQACSTPPAPKARRSSLGKLGMLA